MNMVRPIVTCPNCGCEKQSGVDCSGCSSVESECYRDGEMSEDVDVWLFETQHTDVPFACRCADLMCDHVREHLDGWMRSPIGNNETIELKVTYRSVTTEKFEEMRDHRLIS